MIAGTFEHEGHLVSLLGNGDRVVVTEMFNGERKEKILNEKQALQYIDQLIAWGYQRAS
jgi:hypothetical protein